MQISQNLEVIPYCVSEDTLKLTTQCEVFMNIAADGVEQT